jgi:uncharacterized protein
LNYIAKDVRKNNIRKVMLTLFGGEPLLVLDRFKPAIANIRSFFEKEQIKYDLYLITNGSLLTADNVKLLAEANINRIRITIDGLQPTHDLNRPYKDGRGSFNTIIANLDNFRDYPQLKISIGINVNQGNVGDAKALIDRLKTVRESGVNIEGINIKPIMDNYDRAAASSCGSTIKLLLDEGFMHEFNGAIKYAIDHGFKVPPQIGVTFCSMFTNERDLTVAPDGSVYSCPAAIGNQDFKVGDIANGLVFNRSYYDKLLSGFDDCKDCRYLNLCLGGCGYEAYTQTGDNKSRFCAKAYYEKYTEDLIRLEYYRVTHSPA